MDVIVRVPGSCGELVQGCWQGGPFLVTCPINRYTTVQVSTSFSGCEGLGDKAKLALQAVCRRFGRDDLPWGIRLTSELPRGKGMASSSADIAAVAAAASLAFGKPLTAEEILRLAVAIEPTDGVFFEGLACLDQVQGRLLGTYRLSGRVPLTIFDTGGTVDTLAFHREAEKRVPAYGDMQLQELRRLLTMGTPAALAEAATRSAFLHQAVLPKPNLLEFLHDARACGALGLNVAHSGTVVGVFWPPSLLAQQIARQTKQLQAKHANLSLWGQVYLQEGGIEFQYQRKEAGNDETLCSWRQYI